MPNNPTNLSRALWLLQDKGLIRLNAQGEAGSTLVTPKDISENPKQIKIIEIEAPQLPRSLDDVDAAVINGNYALEAGLTPAKDALGRSRPGTTHTPTCWSPRHSWRKIRACWRWRKISPLRRWRPLFVSTITAR